MNTVEERLARYRYELEAVQDTPTVDEVGPAGASRPDLRRALTLVATAALVIVGLVVLSNRGGDDSPAAGGGTTAFSWTTSRVVFTSNNFTIDVGGQRYSPTGVHVDVNTDPGDATYATLELSWQEHGVPMNVNVYFAADAANWWVTEMRTYNGKEPAGADWVTFMGDEFRTPLGGTYSGDVNLTATEGGVTSHLQIGGMTLALLPSTNTVTSSSVPPSYATLPTATPGADASTTAPEQWYTVQPQDTLATIAELFGVTTETIAIFNGWADGGSHVMVASSTVRIPPGATLVDNAVVPYGSLAVDAKDNMVSVGARNDLTGVCLLDTTEIRGCDKVEQPMPQLVAQASSMANSSSTLIYGIADAALSVVIEDANGTALSQAVMTEAYQGRRAFAATVPNGDGQGYKAVGTLQNGKVLSVPIVP